VTWTALTARTHPRTSGFGPQVAVLLLAVLVGLGIGAVLLTADRSSWSGARTSLATVTGRSDTGVTALADGRAVTLHLAKVPATGTRIAVEVSPDGRARPASYRQTWLRATRSGVALSVLLVVLVQGYRYAVTRRTPSEA
jgi:hypothetical protein